MNFWRCLCICHEVIQYEEYRDLATLSKKDKLDSGYAFKKDPKDILYTGSSLDEITFIEMCRDVGFAYFVERD